MPSLDEPGLVLSALPGGKQPVDAVAGIPEDIVNLPVPQSL
jgi:hypothetical protein